MALDDAESPALPRFQQRLRDPVEAAKIQAVMDDGRAALGMLAAGEFKHLPGDFVAVYEGRVVGSGDDETALRESIALQLGIPARRPAVEYKGEWK